MADFLLHTDTVIDVKTKTRQRIWMQRLRVALRILLMVSMMLFSFQHPGCCYPSHPPSSLTWLFKAASDLLAMQ